MANILQIIGQALKPIVNLITPNSTSSSAKTTNTGGVTGVINTIAASNKTTTNTVASFHDPRTETSVATTRPLQVAPGTDLGDLKTESTAVTYGQQYQAQVYNTDGSIKLVTIPASELVSQTVTVNKLSASQELKNSEATLLQGSHLTQGEANLALASGLRIDLNMALRSKESTPLEYNTLQTPDLKTELVYSFFQDGENDISSQEDPSKDPFSKNILDSKVPMFVKLAWEPTDTIVECQDFNSKTPEEEAIIQQFLKPVRGVANGTKVDQTKVAALLKQTNVLSKDGLTLELVDTHDLPTAFNSISNGRIFKNSALATLNTTATNVDRVDFNDILYDELM